jgi:RimJ/RimL family protein N-acetyltransferase
MNLILARGRFADIAAVTPSEYPQLYEMLICPQNAGAWRYRGESPRFDEFVRTLNEHVASMGVIVKRDTEYVVGFVAIYRMDLRSGYAYITVCVDQRLRDVSDVLGPDAGLAMLRWCFREWPIRKVYAERPAYLSRSRALERFASLEATLSDHVYRAGRYHDLYIYSISRTDIDSPSFELLHGLPAEHGVSSAGFE